MKKGKIEELEEIIGTKNKTERVAGDAFGLGTIGDINNNLTKAINTILEDEITNCAVDLLNNVQEEEPKVSSLWERYVPTIKTSGEREAAHFILTDNLNSQAWKELLYEEEIQYALVEDVGFKLLEDLSNIGDFLHNEDKLIEEWKEQRPAAYNFAKRCVEDLASKVFSLEERNKPSNKEGIEAYKLTRMAAYRTLDAHFTGSCDYEMSPELGGGQYINVRIKSDAINDLMKSDPFAAKQLSFVKLGKVKNVKYDIPDKRKYNKVFEAVLKETDPKSFKGKEKGFSANHAVQELSQKICPIFAREPTYFRQKNFDPEVAYKLYSASKKLSFLSHSSLYPLLGTGKVPGQLPPNFVERFSKDWRKQKGYSLAELAYAGFSPIIHCKLKEIVSDLYHDVPDMMTEMEKTSTRMSLMLARTNDVIVKPIKAAAIQRAIVTAFKKEYSDEFKEILEDKESKLFHLKEKDFNSYTVELRNQVFRECISRIHKDPEKDVTDLEKRLLEGKQDKIVHVNLTDSIKWARGLKKKKEVELSR